MKILLVGGIFDNADGKQLVLINSIGNSIRTADDKANVTIVNGGNKDDLQAILESAANYNYIFWFTNHRVDEVKKYAPHCLLVTRTNNDYAGDEKSYSFEELLQNALANKANLCFEFTKANKVINTKVFDPLGCIWYEGLEVRVAVRNAIDRLNYLARLTRKASVRDDNVPAVEFNEKDKKFLEIVKESANTFHELMCLPKDVKRFVGNASLRFKEPTRCMSGFPAIRKEDLILISRRNVDKTGISEKDFVMCHLDKDDNTAYAGEFKPSVDSPVQLRLFKRLKNIDYILHGHCYVKDAAITRIAIPCGAVEEVNEILDCIKNNYGSYDANFYAINLKGHGCIIMANENELDKMRNVEFYSRPIPEIIQEQKRPNFYLICGISGGGKTTLSQRIIAKNAGIRFYDVDKYYEMINGDECDRRNFFDVWIKLYQDIHDSEMKHEDILLTTNSLTESQRTQFIEWFPSFRHHMLWVTAPKEKCIEGNMTRRRNVPIEKLLAQWERMEFPNANEKHWDTITHITNCWDNENYIIFQLKGDITEYLKIQGK